VVSSRVYIVMPVGVGMAYSYFVSTDNTSKNRDVFEQKFENTSVYADRGAVPP